MDLSGHLPIEHYTSLHWEKITRMLNVYPVDIEHAKVNAVKEDGYNVIGLKIVNLENVYIVLEAIDFSEGNPVQSYVLEGNVLTKQCMFEYGSCGFSAYIADGGTVKLMSFKPDEKSIYKHNTDLLNPEPYALKEVYVGEGIHFGSTQLEELAKRCEDDILIPLIDGIHTHYMYVSRIKDELNKGYSISVMDFDDNNNEMNRAQKSVLDGEVLILTYNHISLYAIPDLRTISLRTASSFCLYKELIHTALCLTQSIISEEALQKWMVDRQSDGEHMIYMYKLGGCGYAAYNKMGSQWESVVYNFKFPTLEHKLGMVDDLINYWANDKDCMNQIVNIDRARMYRDELEKLIEGKENA